MAEVNQRERAQNCLKEVVNTGSGACVSYEPDRRVL